MKRVGKEDKSNARKECEEEIEQKKESSAGKSAFLPDAAQALCIKKRKGEGKQVHRHRRRGKETKEDARNRKRIPQNRRQKAKECKIRPCLQFGQERGWHG